MERRGQEAWDKAAICEAHAQATEDGKVRTMLRKLRDSWIRIGNARQFKDDDDAKRLDRRAG